MPAWGILKDVGAGAGVLSLGWQISRYLLDRRVALRVTTTTERRDEDGIRIEAQNRSPERSVKIRDVEVLHHRGVLRRRAPEAAGPFMQPRTPWVIGPDDDKEGWVPLRAVDGAEMGPGDPKWDFSKPIRVRLKLAVGHGPTSRRCRITRSQ